MSSTAITRNRQAKDFSHVPQINLPRSVFKLGFTNKLTLNEDFLIPIFCKEVLPGDTWEMDMTHFARMASQIVPSYDNVKIKSYFFNVASRLVWDHFPNQHGERENPDDTIDYITPTIKMDSLPNGFEIGSIYDYLGIPTGVPNLTISALPLRAINLIWNTYFRDENLQDALTVKKDDSDDDPNLYKLVKKAKVSDYFTRALPEIQKGDPVMLPIGTTAPVKGDGNGLLLTGGSYNQYMNMLKTNDNNYLQAYGNAIVHKIGENSERLTTQFNDKKVMGVPKVIPQGYTSGLIADLSEALGASITAVRQAIATQELLERDNRNGTRYTEQLEGRYGVTNPDLRLQRPEYLGGTDDWFSQVPVAQTSSTDTTSPQANLSAYSMVSGKGRVVTKSFGEFGYVIGFICIQGIPSYQQGLDRMWGRMRRYDYYYPEFAGLSDQAIKNSEIYAQGNNVKDAEGNIIDEQPFGYQERYAEYRNWNNQICGKMRSTDPQSLQVYHYAEKFSQLPVLNENFIQSNTPIERNVAVKNEPHFLLDIAFDATLYRSMPLYGIPQISSNLLLS